MQKKTISILLADDHSVVREGLRRILSDEPDIHVSAEAATGEEAVTLAREDHINLVLLDLSMPGRGGMDALKSLHAMRPDLPVLVLSMHPSDQYAARCFRAGALGYIMKERPPAELIEAIRNVAAGRQYVPACLADQGAPPTSSANAPRLHERLSDREDQVLRQIVRGKALKTIAEDMRLSVKTVSTYKRRIFEKMLVNNTAELIRYAIDNHLN